MSILAPVPPLDGSLTVFPGFVDFQARHNPDKPWVIYPSQESPTGSKTISYQEFSNATHRIAHDVRPGRNGPEQEVVAVVVHTDTLLYVALLVGMIRAGIVPFPISPRNSYQAICHVLANASCRRLITQSSLMPLMEKVKTQTRAQGFVLRVDELPSFPLAFPQIFGEQDPQAPNGKPYPPRSLPLDLDDLALYLHSSGSTGYPKSIPIKHRMTLQYCRTSSLQGARDRQMVYPLMSSQPVTLFEPQWPKPPIVSNIRNSLEAGRLTKATGLIATPSFLEAWAHDEKTVEYLKTLQVLIFGGGPLSAKTGDLLVKADVRLAIAYGGTEFATITTVFPEDGPPDAPIQPDENWSWMRFSRRPGIRMVPQGDGTYELQVLVTDIHSVNVENLPDVRGYATADLFVPHPTQSGLWRIVGRLDDVIVLSTGEKIVPLQQEEHITSNPLVMGTLMFGREREQAGLLVEPRSEHVIDPNDEGALAEFRNKIWLSVDEANRSAPGFAKIFKEMILVTKSSKPLPRAPKGTIVRKQAIALYIEEIETLYQKVADSSDVPGIERPASWNEEDLEVWMTAHAAAICDGRAPIPTTSLFEQGFDSLGATFMRNRILATLKNDASLARRNAASTISQNFVFDFPTIRQLVSALVALLDPPEVSESKKTKTAEITEMVEKYTAALPIPGEQVATSGKDGVVVLLTGSTGNIGSHILAALLRDQRITTVYALNRPSATSEDRLTAAFQRHELPVELLFQSKLKPLTGNLAQEEFGLSEKIFSEIKDSVTHIIHNAWTVNFNYSLNSFESQIAGVRRVIDMLASLDRAVRLLFTSSVGAAHGWNPRDGPVPEKPLQDPTVASATGYAASKYVVEQIIARAASGGLSLTSLRMGQVCGPKSTGAWGITEWLPIMVKSSVALGCLPKLCGPVAWVPLDAVGKMYIDLLVSQVPLPPTINVVHPRPTTWEEILAGISEELGGSIPFVSMDEWVTKLDTFPTEVSNDELQRIPGLKLLSFFRTMARDQKRYHEAGSGMSGALLFDTEQLQQSSETMRTLPPIDKDHARTWVSYWRARQFLE